MGITPKDDPFAGGRVSIENEKDLAKKARAIAGEAIHLGQVASHIRKHAEFLGEHAEALACKLEA